MNKSKYARHILTALLSLIAASGCRKDYFDINKNPNFPATVHVNEVLPSAEAAIAHVLGNDFQIIGCMWSQYWAQNPAASQYKANEQYTPSANDFDNPWRNLYVDALQNLNFIVNTATAEGKTQYVACAKILEAYAFQLLTDNFGDVPFSQALQVDATLTPKYDSQKDIYNGILKLINDGLDLINPADPSHPGSDDMLLGGDMNQWKKFANTLKLRVYLRLSEIDPSSSQNGVHSLIGQTFLGKGEAVQLNYTSAGGNTNPLYSAEVALGGTQNLVASKTTVDYMIQNNDSLISAFYLPLPNGSFVGLLQGNYNTTVGSISLPNAHVAANAGDGNSALAPVKLLSDYESLFLQSEAAARGWLNAGQEQILYQNGILASYEAYGLPDSVAVKYYSQASIAFPAAGTVNDKVKAIITQKWAAMCGNQGIEAWTEWRRTGYPSFFTQSVVSNIGGGNFPKRLLYPSTELTRNPNMPGQHFIYDKVWWDIH